MTLKHSFILLCLLWKFPEITSMEKNEGTRNEMRMTRSEAEITAQLPKTRMDLSRYLPPFPRMKRSSGDRKGRLWETATRSHKRARDEADLPNYCHVCDVHFRDVSLYEMHRLTDHGDLKPYPCCYCDNRYSLKWSLARHINLKHWPAKGSCFARRGKPMLVKCHVCDAVCDGISELERHGVQAHEGEKRASCSYCEESFFGRKGLARHKYLEHPSLQWRCVRCKSLFDRSDQLEAHETDCLRQRGENAKTRDVCHDVRFGKKRRPYRNHARCSAHPGHEAARVCKYCDASRVNESYLREHAIRRHSDKRSSGKRSRKKYVRHSPYVCQYCGKRCEGVKTFERHGLDEHPDMKLFYCEICEDGFNRISAMRRHREDVHGDGEDGTPCAHCGKHFFRRDHLKTHEGRCKKFPSRTFTKTKAKGVQRHDCEMCQRTLYMKPHSFRWHIYTHHQFEQCPVCYQRFNKGKCPGDLARHMIRRHPRTARRDDDADDLLRAAETLETMRSLPKPEP